MLWLADEEPPREELFVHGVRVDVVDAEHPAGEVARLAPDVVVVGGRSADRARALGAQHSVVVLEPSPPDAPLEGCRGVVARFDPSLEDDVIAARIAALLRRLASRAHASLTIAPGELAALTARIAGEGRAGVLLCGSPPGAITFTAEGARESEVAELRRRTADRAELSLRFFELAPARMKVLGVSPVKRLGSPARLDGLGALVIDGGNDGWQAIVDALSAVGARAQLVIAKPDAIERARSSDPSLIVVASTTLATPAGRLLLEDGRLGSAALVVIDPSRLPIDETALRALAVDACGDELAARARVLAGTPTIERLETLGAARWLKTIARVAGPMRMRVRSGAGHGEIVFGGGKITDARFFPSTPDARRLRGAAAVPALVAVTHGTLLVGPADAAHERPEPVDVRASASANASAGARTKEPVQPPARVPASALARMRSSSLGARVAAPGTSTPVVEIGIETATASASATAPESAAAPASATATAAGAVTASVPATAADANVQATAPIAAPVPAPQLASSPPSPVRPLPRWGRAVRWGLACAAALACAYLAADRLMSTSSSSDTAPADASTAATPLVSSPSAEAPPRDAPLPATADDDRRDEPASATTAPVAEETAEAAGPSPTVASDRARVAALVVQSDEAMRARDYERGLALAQEALALEPRHARAAYDSALAMLRLRRDDEALTWAERAMGWDPTEPLYPLLVGDIHLQHGRRARARAAWRRCLLIDPPHESCARRIELADARDAAD